jgi:uncharacterized Zn-binding protein involved in type VI secretion
MRKRQTTLLFASTIVAAWLAGLAVISAAEAALASAAPALRENLGAGWRIGAGLTAIVGGSPTVIIAGKPAARVGDPLAGGTLVGPGCPKVRIGP